MEKEPWKKCLPWEEIDLGIPRAAPRCVVPMVTVQIRRRGSRSGEGEADLVREVGRRGGVGDEEAVLKGSTRWRQGRGGGVEGVGEVALGTRRRRLHGDPVSEVCRRRGGEVPEIPSVEASASASASGLGGGVAG